MNAPVLFSANATSGPSRPTCMRKATTVAPKSAQVTGAGPRRGLRSQIGSTARSAPLHDVGDGAVLDDRVGLDLAAQHRAGVHRRTRTDDRARGQHGVAPDVDVVAQGGPELAASGRAP